MITLDELERSYNGYLRKYRTAPSVGYVSLELFTEICNNLGDDLRFPRPQRKELKFNKAVIRPMKKVLWV